MHIEKVVQKDAAEKPSPLQEIADRLEEIHVGEQLRVTDLPLEFDGFPDKVEVEMHRLGVACRVESAYTGGRTPTGALITKLQRVGFPAIDHTKYDLLIDRKGK